MGALVSNAAEPSSLEDIVGRLKGGDYDEALRHICHRQRLLKWKALPERMVFLRHGESEGNINRQIYTTKGDAHLELTPKGLRQAAAAGARLKELVGHDRLFVVVSPFERTQQTLLGLYRGGIKEEQVGMVHVSSQIREQEFGNFQHIGLAEAARAEAAVVGRFYYRRPNAESSADVYDRVSAFWDDLITAVLPRATDNDEHVFGSAIIVTHGLTMRLVLMKVFQWSVETFETVWNVENCEHITLTKNLDKMCYQFDKSQSFPQEVPWATRSIWVVLKSKKASDDTENKLKMLKGLKDTNYWQTVAELSEESQRADQAALAPPSCHAPPLSTLHGEEGGKWLEIDRVIDNMENNRMRERSVPYTVLDYLTLPQPRTVQTTELNGRVIEGHCTLSREDAMKRAKATSHINWDDVEFVDWWGTTMSYQGKMLRDDLGSGQSPLSSEKSHPRGEKMHPRGSSKTFGKKEQEALRMDIANTQKARLSMSPSLSGSMTPDWSTRT